MRGSYDNALDDDQKRNDGGRPGETDPRSPQQDLCTEEYPMNTKLQEQRSAYWKANLRILIGCLIVWFIAGYVLPIFMVDVLNLISLGGYPLGFWMAQQWSIYVFLMLIFFYAWRMNRLDRKFDVHEE
jgi:putative solute:sodium symporter small subunit